MWNNIVVTTSKYSRKWLTQQKAGTLDTNLWFSPDGSVTDSAHSSDSAALKLDPKFANVGPGPEGPFDFLIRGDAVDVRFKGNPAGARRLRALVLIRSTHEALRSAGAIHALYRFYTVYGSAVGRLERHLKNRPRVEATVTVMGERERTRPTIRPRCRATISSERRAERNPTWEPWNSCTASSRRSLTQTRTISSSVILPSTPRARRRPPSRFLRAPPPPRRTATGWDLCESKLD